MGGLTVKRLVFVLLFTPVLISTLSCGTDPNELLRLSDREIISFTSLVRDLEDVQLIFIGELHAEPAHHDFQLAVIRALNEAGTPVAVGLEMFRHEDQAELDRWVRGELSETDFRDIYSANWTLPWPLYRDIFVYARQEGLPLVGLNVPSNITKQVSRAGFSSLTPEQIGELPQATCDIDETYMNFVKRAYGAHAHSTTGEFVHFCEAQMVWDASMAAYALSYLAKHPDRTMVVLAGSGHAWRRGIPEQVRRRSMVSYRIILPSIPGKTDPSAATLDDADYVWLPASGD